MKERLREQTAIPHPQSPSEPRYREERPLSPRRAFVVQFRVETNVEVGQIAGRVEHVVSGQATHFQSLDELLSFIMRMLNEVRAPPTTNEGKEQKEQGEKE